MTLADIFCAGMRNGWPDPVTIRRTWTWGLFVEMATCLIPKQEAEGERRVTQMEGIAHRLSRKDIPPLDIAHLRSLGLNVEYKS